MKKRHLFALSCLSLAIMTPIAFARPAINLTVGGGYVDLDSKHHMKNAGAPLIALGYDFDNHWGFEAALAGFRTHFKDTFPDTRRVHGELFGMDAVYRFCPYEFMNPYVLAGVGLTHLDPSGTEAHNHGNLNVGIGAEFPVHRSVAFKLEARDFYTIVGGRNDFLFDAGVVFKIDLC